MEVSVADNGGREKKYQPSEVEARWSTRWEAEGLYEKSAEPKKPFYWLTMLPYPSGDLHIGHWYAMAPSDAGARFKRMQGYDVFFPIGFDAFGLPAENAAIKHGLHPKEWTYKNIERMRGQLRRMGAMWAWKNEIISCEADYYKWNQWIFLLFYRQGLAYREHAAVDFCPQCNTTLAREQVIGEERKCERCDTRVVKKLLNQWKYRITRYAEELLDFSQMDWPEAVCTMQTNWIGRSEGVEFELLFTEKTDLKLQVFTTRPDTAFGITFCVISPEHPLLDSITPPEHLAAVRDYRERAAGKSEIERSAEGQEKDGVFSGAYVTNPFNKEAIPVWVADYVIMGYGTGAVMAVPAHDERDWAFAIKYQLPIKSVLRSVKQSSAEAMPPPSGAYTAKEGSIMCNSGEFDGTPWPKSFQRTAEWLTAQGLGKRTVNYRLRDWLISRQRMWGTPIPIIYCPQCGTIPAPEKDLPVLLPNDAVFEPTGESPLKKHSGFLNTTCPQCGKAAQRETDTMDTFVCSSWYMYAYLSPYWKKQQQLTTRDAPWDANEIQKWLPISQYTGGIEHAIMHLLYLRFYARALADAKLLPHREPIRKLYNQGTILGADGEKMSKSRGNVVNPDELLERYGADTIRAYLMFIGPWNQGGPWNPRGIEGMKRFIQDVWKLCSKTTPSPKESPPELKEKLRSLIHQTLQKATADYQKFKFNTLIAALMHCRSVLKTHQTQLQDTSLWNELTELIILMLAPIAPFITEELWRKRHPESSVHLQPWPQYQSDYIKKLTTTLVLQINGKVRERIEVMTNHTAKELQNKALQNPTIKKQLQNKKIKKVIVVENKLVNIVAT